MVILFRQLLFSSMIFCANGTFWIDHLWRLATLFFRMVNITSKIDRGFCYRSFCYVRLLVRCGATYHFHWCHKTRSLPLIFLFSVEWRSSQAGSFCNLVLHPTLRRKQLILSVFNSLKYIKRLNNTNLKISVSIRSYCNLNTWSYIFYGYCPMYGW